jgi:hypothetical protein
LAYRVHEVGRVSLLNRARAALGIPAGEPLLSIQMTTRFDGSLEAVAEPGVSELLFSEVELAAALPVCV